MFECPLVRRGYNASGQLGVGDTTNRGDTSATLTFAAVNLGTNRKATDIAVGGQHACAILDDGSLKCW